MWRRSDLAKFVVAGALLAGHSPLARAEETKIEPITDPAANSPKEELRLRLFKDKAKAACAVVKTDPRGTTGIDQSLDKFLKDTIEALKAKSDVGIQPLFHKRMNVTMAALAETFARINTFYGSPIDVSIYRLWALNTVDGTPGEIPCDGDGLALQALYGYPLQFGAWLQIMGPKEIGRVYVSIVPADGRWNLGSFHAQQWTQASKDAKDWMEIGAKAASKGHKESAYTTYDLAAKLLDGGSFVEIAARQDALKARASVMTPEEWVQSVKATLTDFEVIYTSTVLVEGGAGVLARVRIPEEISLENLKSQCKRMAEKVLAKPWSEELTGIRCSFNLPKEDPTKEGISGGMYLAFSEVKARK